MNNIREKLIRTSQLLDGGELERDLALQLLREAYSELKFGSEEPRVKSEGPATQPEPYIESEHVVFSVEPIEEPDPEFDPTPAPVPRQAQEPAQVAQVAEPVEAPEAPTPVAEPKPEPFVPRQPVRTDVIRSLYGDTAPRETLNDAAKPQAQEPAPTTLGDALKPETRDVASAAAAAATPIGASLRKSIGLNDRFVMIRDMFRGDTGAFDRTIDRLDNFGSLDEAVIWLHDNFALDPDSEGVGLLMGLLERRFS